MSEIPDLFSEEDLWDITKTSLNVHLNYFTGQVIDAAEQGMHYTMRGIAFTAAVGGVALIEGCSLQRRAHAALEAHNGVEVVANWWPSLVQRSEDDWHDAVDNTWTAVRFDTNANKPKDRSMFGYVELLDALRNGTAHYRSVKVGRTSRKAVKQ